MAENVISFPNLGIEIEHLADGIRVFNTVTISYFGILLGISLLLGFFVTEFQAKRTGQDTEIYLDAAVYVVIFSLLGARIFYILLGGRREDLTILARLMNFDSGKGMTLYGGLIAGSATILVYSFIKKQYFYKMADTCVAGACAGQIVGRISDFLSVRNFGGYTNNLFAMRIPVGAVPESLISENMLEAARLGGYEGFVQVHPLFLYDIIINIVLLILALVFTGKFKKDGDMFVCYIGLYSLSRTFLDGLLAREMSAAQMTAVLMFVGSVVFLLVRKIKDVKAI